MTTQKTARFEGPLCLCCGQPAVLRISWDAHDESYILLLQEAWHVHLCAEHFDSPIVQQLNQSRGRFVLSKPYFD